MPRKRSPHPGVVIRPPRPGQYQRTQIRYLDPDSGKQRYETVPEGADARQYAKRRALELAQRRQALHDGAPRRSGGSLEGMLVAYFNECTVRKSTAKTYKYSSVLFGAWGGVTSGDDLTLAKLREFRTWVLKRSGLRPATRNRHLRQVAAILAHSRLAGRTPRLSAQDITDGLQCVRVALERKDPCRDPAGVLRAAIARHELFGAYVAFLLLTGMRASEPLSITVESIDFDAGLIRLQAKDVKTSRWRDVELTPTRAGYLLCQAMVAGKPRGTRLFPKSAIWFRNQRIACQIDVRFDFQQLRRTTSTYLCSMPGVGLWRASKSLGHNPEVARKHYAGVVRTDATFLEDAMGITPIVVDLVRQLGKGRGPSLPAQALVRALP